MSMETAKKKRGRPPSNKPLKAPTSFRLSPKAHQLLDALAEHMGLSQASVIETVLRDAARARGIEIKEDSADSSVK
jgi:predicted DNA-binding protein